MTGRFKRTPQGTQFVPTLKPGQTVTGRVAHTQPEIQQLSAGPVIGQINPLLESTDDPYAAYQKLHGYATRDEAKRAMWLQMLGGPSPFAHMAASSAPTAGRDAAGRKFFPFPGIERTAVYRRFLDLDDDAVLTRAFEVAQRDLAYYRAHPKDEPSMYRGALLTMHALVMKLAAQVIALENKNREPV